MPIPMPTVKEVEAFAAGNKAPEYEAFQKFLCRHYGLPTTFKTLTAYRIAWDHGHSAGFYEVALVFDELVPLIR